MTDPGTNEWLALCRVAGGGMAKVAGMYFDQGRAVPGELIGVLDRLVWDGLPVVGEGDVIWGVRRISLSEPGQTRYRALCQRQPQHTKRAGVEVPPEEFGTSLP